ncbi:hypothetical protein [Haloarchaeobius amylolyticus]|uniref:hypothetical protein n=1 Tax=Haloarchaeobius amylolyticus TaxID=1198296 RepID=UPI0022719AEE|nr:hypothetical protein [Haloarchaeobius amylolyticus]
MRGRPTLLLTVAVLVVLAGCSATSFAVGPTPTPTESIDPVQEEPVRLTATPADAGSTAAPPHPVGPAATPEPTRTVRHEGDLVVTDRVRFESVRLVVTGQVLVEDGGSLVLDDSVLEFDALGNTSSDFAVTVRGQGTLTADTVAVVAESGTSFTYTDDATVTLRNLSDRTGTTVHRVTDDASLSVVESRVTLVGADSATIDVTACDCRMTLSLPDDARAFPVPEGYTADSRFVVSGADTAVTVQVRESVLRESSSAADRRE